MIGGAIGCIFWYIAGYMKYQSLDNWIAGLWPAIFGSAISLMLVVIVSKLTLPSPREVIEIFFDDLPEAPKTRT